MRRWTLMLCLLLCSGVATLPSSAWAVDPVGTAQLLNVEAQAAWDGGDFPLALAKWQEVYALVPNATTAWNIARCYELMGDWERARAAFALFRDLPGLSDAERADADAKIASIGPKPSNDTPPDPPRPVQPPPKSQLLPVLGWTSLGLASAAAITGVVVRVTAEDEIDRINEISTHGGDRAEYDALASELEAVNWGMGASFVAAGVFGATAATLLILAYAVDDEPSGVALGVSPMGASLRWEF